MISTNRLADYYHGNKVVPYDEVQDLINDAWADGHRDGYRKEMSIWACVSGLGFVVGFLAAWVVS